VRARLAGHHAETLWALPRPAQGSLLGTCRAVSGDQEASHQAQEEAEHDRKSRLTGPAARYTPSTEVSGQPSTPTG
jgi:hypothetical protein